MIMVAVALAVGASFPGGVVGVLVLVVSSALLGAAFAALSNALALVARQRDSGRIDTRVVTLDRLFSRPGQALARDARVGDIPVRRIPWRGSTRYPIAPSVLREIGVEASEQLDIIPQQVRVIRHERVKYACPCCDGALRLAPKPAQVIPKGLLSEGAIAWVATAPIPATAAGTGEPTARNLEATATPQDSPSSERATIEKVMAAP